MSLPPIHPDPDGDRRRRRDAPGRQPRRRGRRRTWRRWLLSRCLALVLLALALTVLPVVSLSFVDPPASAYMVEAAVGAWLDGEPVAIHRQWVDRDAISDWLALAVVAGEDQRFPVHRGFDFVEIQAAWAAGQRGGELRGASTITQQLARNLFLWSGRSWVRKGLEAWFALLMELVLTKARILELYLNVAEFGPGVYGAEAAAQRYFGRSAAALDPGQASRLAAVLPAPRQWSVHRPTPRSGARTDWIARQMRQLGGPAYLDAIGWHAEGERD